MTQEQFEKASLLKEQVKHIDQVLAMFDNYIYECNPPTRMSNMDLYCTNSDGGHINLNEGELMCIKNALECHKSVLQREFGKL